MSLPAIDQANKQNFVVNIQDSEFGKLVVRWRERDNTYQNKSKPMNPEFSQKLMLLFTFTVHENK